MAPCLSPSAVRIWDWRWPSADRIAARLSRSARICFSIASLMVFGGSMALISTRLTRRPHLPVASSSTPRSWLLMVSREVSVRLQVHRADDVAQRGDGELLDGLQVAGDLVGGGARVGDLEVEHGVDLDDQVVLGDHRLRLERHDLLPQVDHRVDPVDVGDDEVEPGLQRAQVPAEPFDVAGARLRHDAHRPHHGEDREQRDEQAGDQQGGDFHDHSLG